MPTPIAAARVVDADCGARNDDRPLQNREDLPRRAQDTLSEVQLANLEWVWLVHIDQEQIAAENRGQLILACAVCGSPILGDRNPR